MFGRIPSSLIVPAFCSLLFLSAWKTDAGVALKYKTYNTGSALWISTHEHILIYSLEGRSVKRLSLSEAIPEDPVAETVESDGILWVSAQSGLYQVDLSTNTVEPIPFAGGKWLGAKIAADFDYLWAAHGDTLWQYDKLGAEWLPFAMESAGSGERVLGVFSNEDEIFVALPGRVAVFSVSDEKWTSFPNSKGTLGESARYIAADNELVFADGSKMHRFLIEEKSWDVVDARDQVLDLFAKDTFVYIATTDKVWEYNRESSTLKPLDIGGLTRTFALSMIDTSLYVAGPRHIIQFDIKVNSSEIVEHPAGIEQTQADLMLGSAGLLISSYPADFSVYDVKKKMWESTPYSSLIKKPKRLSWDEDGLGARWSKETKSNLKGSFQVRGIDYGIRPMGSQGEAYRPKPEEIEYLSNLTLHNEFPGDRYADVFYDNSLKGQVIRKGIYYRGSPSDRLRSARAGTNEYSISDSKTQPKVTFEGGGAIAESKSKLKTRDRKRLRVQSGGGLVTTQTRHKVLSYSRLGYQLDKNIMPGTMRIFVDGEEIDSTLYTVVPAHGIVGFNRQDILDPTSVIAFSYQIRTIPEKGIDSLEFLPVNHFGEIGYVNALTSPNDWISARTSYLLRGSDQIVSLGAPAEIRKKNPDLLLKFEPDISFNVSDQSVAGGGGVNTRLFNKVGIQANGFLADTGFSSTEALTRGYGKSKGEIDYTVGYDITPKIPVSYYQHHRNSVNGREDRLELSGACRMEKFPFLEMSASRNEIDAVMQEATAGGNTLDRLKDKFRIRAYETSSELLARRLSLYKAGYDVSLTEFLAQDRLHDQRYRGRILYGKGTVLPFQSLILSGYGNYRLSPGATLERELTPSFGVQTVDAPKGTDINSKFEWTLADSSATGNGLLELYRSFDLTMRPGAWVKTLGWFSPRAGVTQRVQHPYALRPDLSQILVGSRNLQKRNDRTTQKLGIHVFPNDRVFFQNENKITNVQAVRKPSRKFYTFNDLKVWIGNNDLWQTRWEHYVVLEGESDVTQRGFTRYDHRWSQSTLTRTGVNATVLEDSLKAGPDASILFAFSDISILKRVSNNHSVRAMWWLIDGNLRPSPETSYNLYLRILFAPNIALETNNTFNYWAASPIPFTFAGKLKLIAIF